MPRTTSAALNTQLGNTVSDVGYFVQIGLSSIQRWSNIGQETWNGQTWLERSFAVSGLNFSSEDDLSATLTIANHDGVAGALFINASEKLYNVSVTIYQFARGALAAGDVPLIATMTIVSCKIKNDTVVLTLGDIKTEAIYSPRRRISPADGFNFATPAGITIVWGGEIYITEPDNG